MSFEQKSKMSFKKILQEIQCEKFQKIVLKIPTINEECCEKVLKIKNVDK